jgi:hypothetical protein
MSGVRVTVEIDNFKPLYFPGDILAGWYRLTGDELPELHSLEVSVQWHTEGKGDEDLGVHFFEKVSLQQNPDAGTVRRFSTRLPQSPLSFEGLLVKIVWSVRVRAKIRGGKELLGVARFRLGDVPGANEAPVRSQGSGVTRAPDS